MKVSYRILLGIFLCLLLFSTACTATTDPSVGDDASSSEGTRTYTPVDAADFAALTVDNENLVHSVYLAFGSTKFDTDLNDILTGCTAYDGVLDVSENNVMSQKKIATLVIRIPNAKAGAYRDALRESYFNLYYAEDSGSVDAELASANSSLGFKEEAQASLTRMLATADSAAELASIQDELEATAADILALSQQIASYEQMQKFTTFTILLSSNNMGTDTSNDPDLVDVTDLTFFKMVKNYVKQHKVVTLVLCAVCLLIVVVVIVLAVEKKKRDRRRRRKHKVHTSESSSGEHHHHHSHGIPETERGGDGFSTDTGTEETEN